MGDGELTLVLDVGVVIEELPPPPTLMPLLPPDGLDEADRGVMTFVGLLVPFIAAVGFKFK